MVSKKPKGPAIPSRSDAEIQELAQHLLAGHMVTDRDVGERLLWSVFFPAVAYATQGGKASKAWVAELGLIFGIIGKHRTMGGRAVNGWPMFAACEVLNKADAEKLYATARKMHEAMQAVEVEP